MLCNYVIVEEGTRKVSLIGNLTRLESDQFPFACPLFFGHAVLKDGSGDAKLTLKVKHLETDEEVVERDRRVQFTHRLRELHVSFRVEGCSFPVPGVYEFELTVDRETVSSRRIQVLSTEELP
jgi:hypothetical protein